MSDFFNKDLAESYDIVILGAGPAGCSAGMYAARDAMSVLILEKNYPGGNMAITEQIENYPGFIEPVFGHE
ncbi:MAG: FAD-dependent oxidoreductase, partial [Mucispirillum sp.]|nr:FAD-dependent oxidoreductase [Mucispirillum sp.]